MPAKRLALAQPRCKRVKYTFAGNVNMPQAANALYEGWAARRESAEATFRAFTGNDD